MRDTPQKPDFNYLKSKLLVLRDETQKALTQLESSTQTVSLDQNRVGRLSRMDALQAQAMAKASALRQQVLLDNLNSALAKIDSACYGRCLECDEWIAMGRLELDPSADYCISCAQSFE